MSLRYSNNGIADPGTTAAHANARLQRRRVHASAIALAMGSVTCPLLTSPRINLALLERKAGRVEEAETTLKAAVEASPNNVVAWNELGVTLRMRGRFKDAVDAYDRAIAADPNFAPAHRNLAIVL